MQIIELDREEQELVAKRAQLRKENAAIVEGIASAPAKAAPPIPSIADIAIALAVGDRAGVASMRAARRKGAAIEAEQAAETAEDAAIRAEAQRLHYEQHLAPIEQRLGEIATTRERLRREALEAAIEQWGHDYRTEARSFGRRWAEGVALTGLYVATVPAEARRQIFTSPVNMLGPLATMPTLAAFANCPTPAFSVVFGDPRHERPAGNEVFVDANAVAAEVRQRFA